MSGFSFSKLKQAKPSMRRRLLLYMGALAALLLVTLFAVLLLLGQLKSPREELAKSLTFRMEAFQSDMESLWRNVSVMGLHLSEDMTAILEKQTADLSKLDGDADAVERLEEAMLEPLCQYVRQADCSGAFVVLNTSLLKYGGDVAVGAYTVIASIMQVINLPLQGLTQGAQPITSYNYGARNTQRVRQTFRLLLKVCLCYSVALWAVIQLCPGAFARIFTPNAALVAFTVPALRIYCAALFLFGIQIACQMTFKSTGNAVCSIIVAVVRKFVLLLPLILRIRQPQGRSGPLHFHLYGRRYAPALL